MAACKTLEYSWCLSSNYGRRFNWTSFVRRGFDYFSFIVMKVEYMRQVMCLYMCACVRAFLRDVMDYYGSFRFIGCTTELDSGADSFMTSRCSNRNHFPRNISIFFRECQLSYSKSHITQSNEKSFSSGTNISSPGLKFYASLPFYTRTSQDIIWDKLVHTMPFYFICIRSLFTLSSQVL